MKKIITFLGVRPSLTSYEFNGRVYDGEVFAQALRQFVDFDQMLVCVTEEAEKNTWPVLEKLNDPRIVKIPIPRGDSTAELWSMFATITDQVHEGETVVFDITHGLRSLPFLVFLFAAYLKTARNVKIEAVYYGAYELKNLVSGKPAPVIDLSEFVGMLEWLTAAERFIRFGDSTDLAEMVHKTGKYKERDPISQATQALDNLSHSLRLIRPIEAIQMSAELPDILAASLPNAQAILGLQPYTMLLGELQNAYSSFAQSDPLDPIALPAGLGKQRDLINWYVRHQQWVQAVSLAREWLLSWVIWQLGETDLLNLKLRDSIASTMSGESYRQIAAEKQKKRFESIFFQSVPEINRVLKDWLSIANLRNDIDHAGMRLNSMPAASLIKGINKLCTRLGDLPLESNSIPHD